MIPNALPNTPVHFDALGSASLSSGLRALLAAADLTVSERPEAASVVITSSLERARARGASERVVVLVGGKLRDEHAAALRGDPPALLMACREASGLPSAWEVRALSCLLRRLPLMPVTPPPNRMRVSSMEEIRAAADLAGKLAREAGAGRAASDRATDVMHELTANALLDAPIGPDGTPKYAFRRGPELKVASEDACDVSLVAREGRLFLSAIDLFGRLTPAPIAAALEGLEQRAKINDGGGGAGLGMRRILEQSDLLVVRVRPGQACQVLCAVDLGGGERRRAMNPKSVFFWVDRG